MSGRSSRLNSAVFIERFVHAGDIVEAILGQACDQRIHVALALRTNMFTQRGHALGGSLHFHRPNRELGNRTSFAPETTRSKGNERDRT
jgi:hypothetical protein